MLSGFQTRNILIWESFPEHRCGKQKREQLGWCERGTVIKSKKNPKPFNTEGTDEKSREDIHSLTTRWVKKNRNNLVSWGS